MLNPCIFNGVGRDYKRRFNAISMGLYLFPNIQPLYDNTKQIIETHDKAVKLLHEAGLKQYKKYMAWCLVPRFGKGRPKLTDQKVGGIPDLRRAIYTDRVKGKFDLSRVWPVCGICHEKMKFIAQFDLRDWLLPLHVVTGKEYTTSWDTRYFRSAIGGDKLVEYTGQYRSMWWHIFTCPNASTHYCNPNCDAEVVFSDVPFSVEDNGLDSTVKPYLDAVPHIKTRAHSVSVASRKIDGWDFRIQIDYDTEDQLEELMESNKDVFCWYSDFRLFGQPCSQQMPYRYWCCYGEQPQRMTPLICWQDARCDMTYQVYIDPFIAGSGEEKDGYFAKVDASCT